MELSSLCRRVMRIFSEDIESSHKLFNCNNIANIITGMGLI